MLDLEKDQHLNDIISLDEVNHIEIAIAFYMNRCTKNIYPSNNRFDTMTNYLRKQCERRHDFDTALGISAFQEVFHQNIEKMEKTYEIPERTLRYWFSEDTLISLLTGILNMKYDEVRKIVKPDGKGGVAIDVEPLRQAFNDDTLTKENGPYDSSNDI